VYLARKPDKRTCYPVGWAAHGSSSGVFWDVSMLGGAMRVYCGMGRGLRLGLVGLAARLWRYLQTGLVPTGALLKA